MKILYGPPGTGKTWQAAREAVRAVEPELYSDALEEGDPDSALRKLHDSLVADGRILWVTFHPSYSYEDFVEGYRPIVDDAGQLAYRVVDGPFKTLCLRARFETDLQIGEQLTQAGGRPAGVVVDKDAGGWIVRVTPNRKDEIASTIDKYVPRYVIDRVLAKGYPDQIFSIPGSGVLKLSDYGLDPSDKNIPRPKGKETETTRLGALIRRVWAARTGMFSTSDISNASHYGAVVRRLRERRANSPAKESSVALVIDEINRAEPSRVFGELLTLLEADKREGMPEEKKIWLPYSKTLFSVPTNVSIIGTMNTVDRSLTALDFAMRRRFEFTLVPADSKLVPGEYGGVDVRDLLSRINSRVTILLGNGYEFGHAFLMAGRLEAIRASMSWAEEPDGRLRALAHVFKANILPTLAEYFHDDWSRIRAVAGEARSGTESITLFETPPRDPQFFSRLPDEYEFSEAKSLTYARWWDPSGNEWDPQRFQRFMVALAAGE